jgi:hypothetical protein
MNSRFHSLLLLGILSTVLISRGIGKGYYTLDLRQVEAKANLMAATRIEMSWRAFSYTNAPMESLAEQYWNAIKWDSLDLT